MEQIAKSYSEKFIFQPNYLHISVFCSKFAG